MPMSPAAGGADVPVLTVVHTDACHFCEDARAALAELGRDLPVRVESMSATSPAGVELVREHRPAMFPLVLLDGTYFSAGRLPRRKLWKVLRERQTVGTR